MKVAFFANHRAFVQPIADRVSRRHEVRFGTAGDMAQLLQWADLSWFEWCDDLVIRGSKLPARGRRICRLHSYEAFSDLPEQVDWRSIDLLVFVSESVKELSTRRIQDPPEMRVIPNGVDMARFAIPERKTRTKKIASVGYINHKKNPGLLLYCFKKIHEHDPGYGLHVAGVHQDPRIELYFEHFLARNPLPVSFDGWVEDMPGWYADKDFVISTSYFESFHFSIAEGMACGVLPLVHDWYGASGIYPARYLFQDPDDCVRLLRELEGSDPTLLEQNRAHIADRFDLDRRMSEILEVMGAPPPEPAAAGETRPDGITLTIIARDEETGIGRAIDSTTLIASDVVVLVDDATTDSTARVARDHGARTHPFTWTGDFSAARNEALSHVKTRWALVLDGHEYVSQELDPTLIARAIEDNPEAGGFMVPVRMEDGEVHRSTRLHRVQGAVWRNPAHNVLYVDGPEIPLDEMLVIHDRDSGQSGESRHRRSLQRDEHLTSTLRAKVSENIRDTRSIFYLAQQHRDAGRWEAAHYWYRRYNQVQGGNQWPEESFQAHYEAGRAAMALKDPQSAESSALEAIRIMPGRAEGWSLLGDSHYARESFQQALEAFEQANGKDVPTDAVLWVERAVHRGGWKILDSMTMCCWHLGLHARGLELCDELLSSPDLPPGQRGRVENNRNGHASRLENPPSHGYWERRYLGGGNSGAGSYGRLAGFKAETVNGFMKRHSLESLLDHGCGDGNIASLITHPYTGLDVSPRAVALARQRAPDHRFFTYPEAPDLSADLCLSLDVIFHLLEQDSFEEHMARLFDTAQRHVIIYSSNTTEPSVSPHIRHRRFTDWISTHRPGWELAEHIPNRYPYDPGDPENTSMSEFYIYSRKSGT